MHGDAGTRQGAPEKERWDGDGNVADLEKEIVQLREEHQDLERRLEDLNGLVYLTPAEQVEEARIKKRKLQKKDRIRELEGLLSG